MLRKLGKSITVVNAIAFSIVILVGGVSIYLTKDILHNTYKVEELSKDIITIYGIHADAYRLVLAIHHFLIEQDETYSKDAIEMIDSVTAKLNQYIEEEQHELVHGKNMELGLLNVLSEDVEGFKEIALLMQNYSLTGTFDRDELVAMEAFAYEFEETVKEINKIHLLKIQSWIDGSLSNMWVILFIYLVFITIGGMAIYAGHRVLLKKVVEPIKALAVATIEFAGGTLDKRVYTDSQTEIGQLYQSFNRMAENLQENDEILRKFNEKLEKKVEERTLELQETNKQLKKTQNALIRTEKIAAVGQIAAGVTHEIKNPLNSLSINTQMLMRDLSNLLGAESSAHETATHIRYEINRINNILEEFVKFAKFPEPQFYDNDITQVITEVVDLESESAKEAGVTINLLLQRDIPTFKFDARQFKEIFINLFQNAIKAIKESGTLDVETTMADGNVIIKVKDNGAGISEKNLKKIFSPFFSTKEGGMGLGLPIVQRIVESHGGKISCTSEVGTGTVFEITIPLERG